MIAINGTFSTKILLVLIASLLIGTVSLAILLKKLKRKLRQRDIPATKNTFENSSSEIQ